MIHSSLKTTIFFLSIVSSGLLSAVSPAKLGRECVQATMTGLVQLIKHDHYDMSLTQARVRNCVSQAIYLNELEGRRQFLEAGIAALESMDLAAGTFIDDSRSFLPKVYHLDSAERAYASLCKHFGIEVFKEVLQRLSIGSLMPFPACRTLFSGLPFMSKQRTYEAFARAAVLAHFDVDGLARNVEVAVKSVARELYDVIELGYELMISDYAKLAMQLIHGEFGDHVAAFVCGAKLFALA